MKIIDAPSPVVFEAKDDKGNAVVQEFPFKKFLQTSVESYEPAGKGIRMIRQADKILNAIEGMDGHLTLEDEEFNVLKAAVEAMPWKPPAARKFIPFYEAVEKAQTATSPTEKK